MIGVAKVRNLRSGDDVWKPAMRRAHGEGRPLTDVINQALADYVRRDRIRKALMREGLDFAAAERALAVIFATPAGGGESSDDVDAGPQERHAPDSENR
jgi:predicted transcriptional regulator